MTLFVKHDHLLSIYLQNKQRLAKLSLGQIINYWQNKTP